MKDFFRNRTWDDYFAYAIIGIISIGLILFFVGFFWGFNPIAGSGKINVSKLTGNAIAQLPYEVISGSMPDKMSLFDLAGYTNADWGAAYGMIITSILGFSLIMLGLALVIIFLLVGIFIEKILPKLNK